MATNRETIERLWASLQHFYPFLVGKSVSNRPITRSLNYEGKTITKEDFKSELLAWAGSEDDLAFAIKKLREDYKILSQGAETVTEAPQYQSPTNSNMLTPDELAELQEKAEAKSQTTKRIATEVERSTNEEIEQRKKAAERKRIAEELKNKNVYAKVDIPEPQKMTEKEQEAYNLYKNAVKAVPPEERDEIVKKLSDDLQNRVSPVLTNQGLTPEEIENLTTFTALTMVDKILEEDLPEYIPISIQSAVLTKIANDTKVVEKIIQGKENQQSVHSAANNVAVFKIHPDQVARQITTIAFGEGLSENIFGTSPNNIRVEVSEIPADGYTQVIPLAPIVQTNIEVQESQDQTAQLVSQFGSNKAKEIFLKQTGTVIQKRIASLPAQSAVGKILKTPEAQSLLFSAFGAGTIVKWEATNWVGGLALKVAPQYAPIVSAFGKLTGVSLIKPAAATAVTKTVVTGAGKKVASRAVAKTALKGIIKVIGGVLGNVAGLAISELVIRAGSWLLKQLSKHKDKIALGGIVALATGVVFGSAPLMGIGTVTLVSGVVGGATFAGIGLGATAFFGTLGGIVIGTIGLPILITILALPVILALILFIINSGAFVVPPSPLSGSVTSPYIDIVKRPNPSGPFQNTDLEPTPLKIEYTVTIKAKKGPLSNVRIEYSCNVVKEGTSPSCPPGPSIPTVPGGVISPGTPFSFTYTQEYDTKYTDSFVTDIITVTADVPEERGVKATGSATIKIGEPPEECPRSWPTGSGYISQGAYTRFPFSHRTLEAIDIGVARTSVMAGHSGTVVTAERDSCLGNYIEIKSTCAGREFISQYGHLEGIAVRSGQFVTMGQPIGLSGNTGVCTTGPHLHYEFRYWPSGKPSWPDNPPYMMLDYIPSDVERGCTSANSCGVSW